METLTDSFNENSESLRLRREAEDFDNLQHTLSGVETGQQTRHGLNRETGGSISGDNSKSIKARIRETLDWLLLNDAAYRQAYDNLMGSIRSAQTATQTALERVLDTLETERAIMDEILSSTAKLPDGILVFKDKDENLRSEDGTIISSELAATIEWTGNEPSYEEYLAQRQRIERLEAHERELHGLETEIGEIHEGNTRNDKPPTPDAIKRDNDRVDEIEKRIQEIEKEVSPELESASSFGAKDHATAHDLETQSATVLPKIPLGS